MPSFHMVVCTFVGAYTYHMKNLKHCFIFIAAGVFLMSCTDKIHEVEFPDGTGCTVAFSMGNNSPEFKSSVPSSFIGDVYSLNEEGLVLEEEVTVLDDCLMSDFHTKGAPVYTETLYSLYGNVAVTPYNSSTGEIWGREDVAFDYDEEREMWWHNYSYGTADHNLAWPQDGDKKFIDLDFVVKAPVAMDGCSSFSFAADKGNGHGLIEFDYTSPTSAAAQKDIVLSSKKISYEKKTSESIVLFHPLTGVKFKVSNPDEATITKVTVLNVVNSGTCEVAPVYTSGKKSADVVTWTSLGEVRKDYSVSVDELVTADPDEKAFPESFYEGKSAENNYNEDDFSLTFWFVPQGLDDVKVKVEYKIGDTPGVGIVSFGKNKTWKAGELHTYTLTVKEVGVTITDKVEDGVKKNVVITNTGNVDEFIRVVAVANWCDASGKVMSPWTGSFTLGTGWSLNSKDGYYYYSKAVKPGQNPDVAIFSTYTAPESPVAGGHLVMDLAVQAIPVDDFSTYSDAWKNVGVTF